MNSDYTREQCIIELNNLAKVNPDKNITRDFYRAYAEIPETAYLKHFGTFKEFKRAAGFEPSKSVVALLNNIASHSSRDYLDEVNKEKRHWEGAYLRPSSRRFQTHLIGSDAHDLNCDPFWRRLFIETARRVQPEMIVLNGDFFDNPDFSKYTVDPRNFKLTERIQWVHDLVGELRTSCPEAEINFIAGNHEERLFKYIAEKAPAMGPILDGAGITVSDLLQLSEYEVNLYARCDLKAFRVADIQNEVKKNYIVYNEQVVYHHFPEGLDFKMPGCHGHHHKFKAYDCYSKFFGAYNWWQTGGGQIRRVEYTNAEKWQNGFMLAHLDTLNKRTQLEPIDCTNDLCVIGGKYYVRTPEEKVFFV